MKCNVYSLIKKGAINPDLAKAGLTEDQWQEHVQAGVTAGELQELTSQQIEEQPDGSFKSVGTLTYYMLSEEGLAWWKANCQ